MRKRGKKLWRICLGIVLGFAVLIIVMSMTMKPQELIVSDIAISEVRDGFYLGEADNGLVKVAVSVRAENGTITEIEILEHDNLLGRPAEKLIEDIVEKQTLDVDAVSSATYSSHTIRKAIEAALQKGRESL